MQAGTHELLGINEIVLDLENPRIRRFLEIYEGEPSAEQIALALGFGEDKSTSSGTSFSSLKESIRTHKGIIHPIIVNRDEMGRLVVVEGNTRLAIFREFKRKEIPGNWEEIPAIVFDTLPSSEIDAIRLQAHLVGPREWDPYSKAKYLHHLSEHEEMPFSRLVEYCGGRRADVERFIAAFEDMEEFYRPIVEAEGADFDVNRFSGFVELQKQSVKQSLGLAGFSLSDFARWIHDRHFDRLEHVRSLPRILKHREAKKIFLKQGSREALKALDTKDTTAQLKDATMEALCNELRQRLAVLPFPEVKNMQDNPEGEKAEAILGLRDEIETIADFIISESE